MEIADNLCDVLAQLTDENDPGNTSDYYSGYDGNTESLTPSVYDYQYENGRRYQNYRQGNYTLPNDEVEQDRLDRLHHLYTIMMDGELCLVEFEKEPEQVLDVGTGTGIWAMEFADTYPNAEVTGTDLSPIQADWIPSNCRFEIDDAESEWTYGLDKFDFIHSRHLQSAISDWPTYISRIYDHLKPGGWVQLCEMGVDLVSDNDTYPANCRLREYMSNFQLAAELFGRPVRVGDGLKSLCTDARFINVKEDKRKLPWAPYSSDPKLCQLGKFCCISLETGMEAYALALFTRVLGMSQGDAKSLCSDALDDLKSNKMHVYNWHYFVIAQKPLN